MVEGADGSMSEVERCRVQLSYGIQPHFWMKDGLWCVGYSRDALIYWTGASREEAWQSRERFYNKE